MRATARLIQGCTLAALMVTATVLPAGAAGAMPLEWYPNARVSVVGTDTVKFSAAALKIDYLVITSSSSMVRFDNNYPITPGAGCVNADGDQTVAICYPADVDAVLAYVYDGDDTVVINTEFHITKANVYGGSGNDLLKNDPTKSYLTVRLFGEAGDDKLVDNWYGEHHAQLYGGDGNDHLSCTQTGNNWESELYGGSGADIFDGKCMVDYSDRTAHVNVSIDGIANDGAPGEGDNVQTSVLGLFGGSGNDVLTSKVKTLMVGNEGADWLFGSDFNDDLRAYGDGEDIVFGGYGNDNCSVDASDTVSYCE